MKIRDMPAATFRYYKIRPMKKIKKAPCKEKTDVDSTDFLSLFFNKSIRPKNQKKNIR